MEEFVSLRVEMGLESFKIEGVEVAEACADKALIRDPPPIPLLSSHPPPKSSSSISSFTAVGLQSSRSSQSFPGMLFTPVDMDAMLISVGSEKMLCPVTLSTPTALNVF